MRVVLLLDRPFARRERAMLRRLEIGLADEGVRVVHAVPREILESEPTGLYSSVIGYDDGGFPLPRRTRVRKLLEALHSSADDAAAEPISLVHAFAPAAWRLGLDAAALMGCAAALEVWSAGAIGAAVELSRHATSPWLLAADDAIFQSLSRRTAERTALTAWGVHGEIVEREPQDSDRAIGVAVLVDGSDTPALDAALAGIAAASRKDPRIMVFINAGRDASHLVWRRLRKLGLAERASLITDAEARREAVLRLDLLVVAEPTGRIRSMTLDAMACGVPVVAAADSSVGSLIDGITARLVTPLDAGVWEQAIVAGASGGLDHVRTSAGAWVRANRSASSHVTSVLRAYEAMTAAVTRRAA